MNALLYVVWVSIPASLLLFSLFVRMRQSLLPRESDNPQTPRLLLRAANVFAIYGVGALIVDQYLLNEFIGRGKAFPELTADQLLYVRWSLLPCFAIFGFVIGTIRRLLKPPGGFDRLRIEVQGSNAGMLTIAFLLFGAILLERDTKFSGWSSDATPEKGAEGQPKRQKGLLETLSGNIKGASDSAKGLLGIEGATPENSAPKDKSPSTLPIPVYNPEGAIKFLPLLREISQKNQVDPYLVQAIIEITSGFNQGWEGSDGRKGLMGLTEELQQKYRVRNVLQPYQNLDAGSRHLKHLLDKYEGDVRLSVAAFYAGESAVAGPADLTETPQVGEFVERVISIHEIIKAREGRL